MTVALAMSVLAMAGFFTADAMRAVRWAIKVRGVPTVGMPAMFTMRTITAMAVAVAVSVFGASDAMPVPVAMTMATALAAAFILTLAFSVVHSAAALIEFITNFPTRSFVTMSMSFVTMSMVTMSVSTRALSFAVHSLMAVGCILSVVMLTLTMAVRVSTHREYEGYT
mmetsp:Transcript_28746/g.68367  ORF Transcript_28746/g.68367 Transcript_28746/m.68367 type:complete len:168 (-) Transcript_28746:37-540(-)